MEARPHHEAASEQPAHPGETAGTEPEGGHSETSEADERTGTADSESREAGESGERAAGDAHESETVFGIPAESPGTVAAFVAASLLLAAAVWRRPSTGVCALVALFAASAAVLDIAEIHHQAREGTVSVAVIAAIVAALHTATTLAAARTAAATRNTSPRPL
ncbi:hypothetical protein [Pseudofrankia inefficax]|uniref:Uncharacterized protein n=1 Tax=Pseudofrankia inefficax (strain DSM 45817 / CECT 9037 / DDB 130130 / EuI1c) TaxID=298654 RepID=E3J684_PSEI1|nr:hypothetical protein [Pseudofrankia inefficax]ADP79511.1 hypothetical protein FraEuI1c_1447 [Pseudofrankia inefficax]